ncbi:hypothetical protein CRD36_16040 [Paremcibacter congregatus]|uniref:Uncharacterized protein n=1 Tax=Paremcibacter congregatus TaxID=2043170 RepID=A0A2G4YNF1_9PROT|nr:hypothetical protein CRD36_16040 [Paremcibacter congregatus]
MLMGMDQVLMCRSWFSPMFELVQYFQECIGEEVQGLFWHARKSLAAGKKDLEIVQASLTLAPVTRTGENSEKGHQRPIQDTLI